MAALGGVFEAWWSTRSRLERAAFRISLVGIGPAVQTYAGVLLRDGRCDEKKSDDADVGAAGESRALRMPL
jgi:hypothetical protein